MKKIGKIVLVSIISIMLFSIANVYAEDESTLITDVSITGLRYPIIGETASANFANVKVPEDANYTINSIEWTASDNGMYYYGGWTGDITLDEGYFYQYNISLKPNEGYSFSEDEEGFFNGTLSISDLNYMDSFVDNDGCLFIVGESLFLQGEDNSSYKVTEGANQEYIKGESTEIKFVIDANPQIFGIGSSIYIDGEAEDNLIDYSKTIYDTENRSVTLTKEYADTFTEGVHTIVFEFFNDKKVETTFTVVNKTTNEETNTKTEITPPNTGIEKEISSNDNLFLILVLNTIIIVGTITNIRKRFN